MEAYAIQLIGVLEPFFEALDEHKIVAEIIVTDTAPLQVIRFGFVSRSSQHPVIQTTFSQGLEETIKKIAKHLPQKIDDNIYTRRLLRIYKGDEVYVVKPAERRYWSRSAGLNDADAILAEHLGAKRDPLH